MTGWRYIPCVLGCDVLILAPPSCERAWHAECAAAAIDARVVARADARALATGSRPVGESPP